MDKRGALRHPVLKAGIIEFDGGAFSCAVRNKSNSGAMLDVPSPIGIPHRFVLAVEDSRILCHVIWRKAKQIGVAFG